METVKEVEGWNDEILNHKDYGKELTYSDEFEAGGYLFLVSKQPQP